jgi:hypothetical protein
MDVVIKSLIRLVLISMVCISLFGVNSCQQKEPKEKLPVGLIGKDTMVKIITEFHLIESSLGIRIFEDKKMMNTRNSLKAKIYSDYGITKEKFIESYSYYAKNNDLIDSIYADVLTEISKRQAEQLKQ